MKKDELLISMVICFLLALLVGAAIIESFEMNPFACVIISTAIGVLCFAVSYIFRDYGREEC